MTELVPLRVVENPEAAAALVSPLRQQLLAALEEPDSAAGLARRVGLPRQQINYHLRELERLDLLEEVEQRRKGNCIERLMRRKARAFVLSPRALGVLEPDDRKSIADRFSWAYLAGSAARTIRDLGLLRRRADATGKRVPTLCLEVEARIGSSRSLEAFSRDLASAVAAVVERHHDPGASRGRSFRVVLGAYPAVPPEALDLDRASLSSESANPGEHHVEN